MKIRNPHPPSEPSSTRKPDVESEPKDKRNPLVLSEPSFQRKPSWKSEPDHLRSPKEVSEPLSHRTPYKHSEPYHVRNPQTLSEPTMTSKKETLIDTETDEALKRFLSFDIVEDHELTNDDHEDTANMLEALGEKLGSSTMVAAAKETRKLIITDD